MAVETSRQGQSPLRALKDELAGVLDANRLPEAIELCQRIVMMDPNDGMERLRLGRILERLGRWREAHEAYREAAHLFEGTSDFRRAKAACSLLIALRPDDAEAYRLRARYARPVAARLAPAEEATAQPDPFTEVERCHGWGELDLTEKTTPAR